MCALLAIATSGCKQVGERFTQLKDAVAAKVAARRQPAARPGGPAGPAAPATPPSPTPPGVSAPPAPPAPSAPAAPPAAHARPLRDVPFDSPDTGTIAPGMSERDVYALWGPPIAVRRQGDMTYLYFRNGCEYSCGTEDVVFLQNGQVVDAVLRWPGHRYSGQSSSPAATQPHARRGGDTLTAKPPQP
jgi:hypothetical protein